MKEKGWSEDDVEKVKTMLKKKERSSKNDVLFEFSFSLRFSISMSCKNK